MSGGDLDAHFAAAVEATEEAVVTALLAACDVTGRDGRTVRALPFDAVRSTVTPPTPGDQGSSVPPA